MSREFKAIPDNKPSGASTSIVAANVVSTGGVTVSVDIAHFWRGDLIVTLLKDGRVLKVLSNREGGFDLGRGIHDTYVLTADEIGPDLNGTYTLHVVDAEAVDAGTIDGWKLAFCDRTGVDVASDVPAIREQTSSRHSRRGC